MNARPCLNSDRYRLKPERILACGNHSQGNRMPVPARVHVLGFQPRTQARIVDLGLALPKIRSQSTLDRKVIQLQFNRRDIFREVPPHIVCADK